MSTVSPVAGPTGAAAAGAAISKTQTLDYDAFLQLLVTQMKHQDPLEPVSDTEYVAQLATFSNVEQNIITNERLAAMMTANALGDAQALIGRTVTAPDGTGGLVEAVQITAGGTLALLADGTLLPVGEGIVVS